jgi:D-alanyl-D-alanine carboxypeptidase/D-alanyl-D-alanine-endopeptidase (penicillin-binding protein 4)
MYAERILRTVASAIYPSPGPVRPSLRSRAADPLLERLGINPVTFVVADGSGLSRSNRLTPIGIVRLLEGMHEHPDPATRDAFVRSLPLGGFTGTLDRRYRAGDARGNVRAKTGYIRGVRTLSGYVTTARNHTIAFSILCNDYRTRTSRVNQAQDEVVELLADYLGM